MNSNQMKKVRVANLNKGKLKDISFFEKITLKVRGFVDGKRGLPREDKGDWVSPHLDREVRSYDEFASRMWGYLQIEEEAAYARLGELMDSLLYTKAMLEEARADLKMATEDEKSRKPFRKHGESRLTESQVIVRRANERAKRLAVLRGRVSSLEGRIASDTGEFLKLRNRILEDNNSTRMICNRVKDHLHQRLDTYWNAALWRHPDTPQMPVIPCVELASRAEGVYMELHKHLIRRADLLSQMLSNENDEKEVA